MDRRVRIGLAVGLTSLVVLVGTIALAGSRASDEPDTATAPTTTTAAPTTTAPTTTPPPPWSDLDIDEPDLPRQTMDDWDTSVADVDRVHPVQSGSELEEALADARAAHVSTGELQEVLLEAGGPYEISAPLTVPTGVRLRGRSTGEAFQNQVLAASTDFPPDVAMVTLSANSALHQIQVDGRNTAWRIAQVGDATDVTVSESRLGGTNSRLGLVDPPFAVDGSRPHTDLLLLDRNSSRVLVQDSTLEFAGIDSGPAGRGAEPRAWSAFSSAVGADNATDVTIRGNKITDVATAGISVWRAKRVAIIDNTIEDVGRNIEWWTKDGPVGLGDGITGYNHASATRALGERHWIISGNQIRNSGNHGLHLSGMTIYVGDNEISNVQQVHVFFGGTLSGNLYDCVENIRVEDNTVIDSTYERSYETPNRLPKINTEVVLVRHYVDANESPEAVLVRPADVVGFPPGTVDFAVESDQRECDERMADG